MNSRERVLLALDHRQPDRVPLDLGGTGLSTMHHLAYANLRNHLALPPVTPRIGFLNEQLALIDADLAERFQTDVRLVLPGRAAGFAPVFEEQGDYEAYNDEWGIGWRKPVSRGLYYDMYRHPLAGLSLEEMLAYRFPDPVDDGRFAGLREQAEAAAAEGKAVALAGPCAGVAEVYAWMRGYEEFYCDLALQRDYVRAMVDRLVEYKCAFWKRALAELGDLVDVVIEADDIAGQNGPLMSLRTYRSTIKPGHRQLFSFIKQQAPVKIFYHCCGAVRSLLPDLIDAGIDILNPVQMSAAGMNLEFLKRDFGRDLTFWGGGVDTQRVLGEATPQEIREHVRRNMAILAGGGGFVFAAVHDIQANVPPENIVAMWEAWRDFSVYS